MSREYITSIINGHENHNPEFHELKPYRMFQW